MTFKKNKLQAQFLFQIIAILFISACGNSEKNEDINLEGKLSTDIVSNPRTLEHTDTGMIYQLGHLQFDDTTHDFGLLKEGEIVTTEFEFENVGKKEIFISEAKASCGCTKPEYPKEMIRPNEKGSIKVSFNSEGKIGINNKTVIVTTNGNPSQYVLYIKNEVRK